MRPLLQRVTLLASVMLGVFAVVPSTTQAQKALVYCPVSVDATGCNAIVTALSGGAFPLGVDRGFDGTGGTVDLKTVDLFTYSVFVVPSLADGATSQPYAKLRDPEVVEHLKAALIGRIALWSGSPDQGATNRAAKDALIQNLAAWAGGAFGTAKGPGLVGLLDASSNAVARYDWLRAITPLAVSADANLVAYSGARALDPTGTTVLTSGAGPIAYDNMATYGFTVPAGAPGVSLDAVGQTGTSSGGQVTLVTVQAGNASPAVVRTDKDDYVPGEKVVITGSGWQAGETVQLTIHVDPLTSVDRVFNAVVDGSGNFTTTQFSPAIQDIGVRFVLTAVGQGSGLRAQTTFTDGNSTITGVVRSSVPPNAPIPGATVSCTAGCNKAASTTTGADGSYSLTVQFAGGNDGIFTLTASFAPTYNSVSATISVEGNANATRDFTLTPTAPVNVATTLVLSPPSPSPVAFGSTGAVTLTATLTRTSGGAGVGTATVGFSVDGVSVGSTTTNASGVATISTYNPSTLNAGGHSIQASFAGATIGGTAYTGSTSGTQTLNVTKATPTITWANPADITYATPLGPNQLNATASVPGTFAYSPLSGTVLNAGDGQSLSVIFTPNDATNYNTASKTVAIKVLQGSQAIVFTSPAPSNAVVGGPTYTVAATGGGSGGAVTFSSATPTVCSVTGSNGVNMLAAGTCTIDANQAGNTNYSAAPQVSQSFAVGKAFATITLSNLTHVYDGTAKQAAAATTPLGLTGVAIAYKQGGSAVASPTNAGSYDVVATLSNANYHLAPANDPTTGTLTIAKADQTIDFTAPTNKTFGDPAFTVTATASSGLPVTFQAGETDDCTIDAQNKITITGAGSCTITASQGGNANYNAATSVSRTIAIAKASATITLDAATLNQTYNGSPRVVTATTTPAGLTVVTITYNGSTTPPINAGNYSVIASLTNDNYEAPSANGTLAVAKANQTISFDALTDKTFGDAPFTVSATATSTLSVTFAASGSCSVSGAQVTITGAGTCTITAKQDGNQNYNGAPDVPRAFTIAKFTPTVIAQAGTYTYDGTPKAATAEVKGVGGAVLTTPTATFEYNGAAAEPVDAGTYVVVAKYAGDANYNQAASAAVNLVIDKATPTITWATPAAIVYGTLLSDTQLNATAKGVGGVDISGAFTYTPAAGKLLEAGVNQTLTANFTSSNQNYKDIAGTTVQITVNKAIPTVNATGATSTYDGQPHAATATVTGISGALSVPPASLSFTYAKVSGGSPSPTAPVNAGTYAIVATYAGDANYESASSTNTANIVIDKATPVFSALASPIITYGTASTSLGGTVALGTLIPTGSVSITLNGVGPQSAAIGAGGSFSKSFTTNALVVAGTPYAIAYTYPGDDNFNAIAPNGAGTLTVNKAPLTAKADDKTMLFGATTLPQFTVSYSGFVNSETPSVIAGTPQFMTVPAVINSTTPAGQYPITPSGVTSPNYSITFQNGALTILDKTGPLVSGTTATPNPVALTPATPITIKANVSDATTGGSAIVSAYCMIDGVMCPQAMTGAFGSSSVAVTTQIPARTSADVIEICVYGKDSAGNTSDKMDCALVAIYDPNAGFVTGGGWVNTPAGSYKADVNLTGKATFGFVSKYEKGKTVPSGNTEFVFHAAGMNFKSTIYDWLVVAGARAQYKGSGKINDAGDYGFLLTAIDGEVAGGGGQDKFRVKIWNKSTGAIVYDNQMGADDTGDPSTLLGDNGKGGGSIVIHQK
jgi:hypothetical protein